MHHVRRLRPAERDAALATVVAAFVADPLVRWWFPDDGTFPVLAERFFGVLLDTRLDGGEVWGVVEPDGTVAAVSMWVPPGGNLIGPDVACELYSAVVTALPAPSSERVSATDEVIDELLPTEPHWYLGVLATHPQRRGGGLGTAVCGPVFAAADRAGVPIVLETANAGNVGYYTRRGFSVLHQFAIDSGQDDDGTPADAAPSGDDGVEPLTVRIMLRTPRADGVG